MASFTSQRALYDIMVKEFNDMIDNHCLLRAKECGKQFVLVHKLKSWLSEIDPRPRTEANSPTRIYCLAETAYSARLENQPGVPVDDSALITKYPLTFCILLRLKRGHLIDSFQRKGLVDTTFPLPYVDLKKEIESIVSKDEQLLQGFYDLQWAFFPPMLEHFMDRNLSNKDRIFPIVMKSRINEKGLTAKLWQIAVPEEFVEKRLRREIEGSVFEDPTFGKCYQFALKSFEQGRKKNFESEKKAFDGLRGHEGVVKYLGNFDRKERKVDQETGARIPDSDDQDIYEMTHNILLEYGESDLQAYFYENYPPKLKGEINEFWEDLFGIAQTVQGIHKLKSPCSEYKYLGLHADIKPLNILNVAGKFKLADPGFMTFVKDTGKPMAVVSPGGTWTFGPPEQQQSEGVPVSQAVDIWSLACVFSIAATWLIMGAEGIVIFEKARMKHTDRLQAQAQANTKVVEAGDQFHDGTSVLSTVREWHQLLRRQIRKSDCITEEILNLIDQRMLLGSANDRIQAGDLCTKLLDIMLRAKEGPEEEIPPEIKDSLIEHDNSAPMDSTSRTSLARRMANSPTSWEERQARKVDLENSTYLKKTTHRSAVLQSAPRQIDFNQRPPDNRIPDALDMINNTSPSPRRQQRQVTSIVPNGERGLSPFHIPQDVFQVRETQDYPSIVSVLREKFGKKEKDKLLSDHFKDRDIKFLVDNAESMDKWWARVKFFLEVLVRKTAKEDDDGIDVTFTNGDETIKKLKKWDKIRQKEFIKTMDTAKPDTMQVTDIDVALRRSFMSHLEYLRNRRHFGRARALTLIVLTDGLWLGTPDKQVVVKKLIANFVRGVRAKVGSMMPYPVSIEFVQFGRDLDARVLFVQLDDDLKNEEQIEDVIDTEYWDGDVYKILLGSFNPNMDKITHEDSVLTSP